MFFRFSLIVAVIICAIFCGRTNADTKVGEFEALDHEQRVTRLTDLTRNTLDQIAAKNPVAALQIQEYFIIPPPGEKSGRGAVALLKQIAEYNQIDPQGYTIENAFAKVLTDYLAQNAATTRPVSEAATRPAATQRS